MKPSDALFDLLEARERLAWEERKSTPSRAAVQFATDEVERLKSMFNEAVYCTASTAASRMTIT
jgi:hypothetical protein